MSISIEKTFGIFDDALILRARRDELLASNLANADTPNYKARDIDFKAALEQARRGTGTLDRSNANHMLPGGVAMQATHSGHFSLSQAPLPAGEALYEVPSQPSLDGNTVDAEREKVKYLENANYMQADIAFLQAKIRSLKELLKEQ